MDAKRILALTGVTIAGMVGGYFLLNPPKAPARPTQIVQTKADAVTVTPAQPAPVEVQYQYVDAPAQSSERGEHEGREHQEHQHEHQGHDD